MNKIITFLKKIKRFLRLVKNNIKYIMECDLREKERDLQYKLTDKIIEDCVYEFEEDKNILKSLDILDAKESIQLLEDYPKSFCRFGDGEIQLIQGKNQAFQEYNPLLAEKLSKILMTDREDIYVAINRAYFHSPLNCSEDNRKFYRIYSTEYRRFFVKNCNPDRVYLDAGFLTAYYRYDEKFDYEGHYRRIKNLFLDKKIAIVCGTGVIEKLEYDVFDKAKSKMIIHGPAKNAFDVYDKIISEIKEKVSKDHLICLILGMTAKIMVPELTELGYMAWDVGHMAKDYDAYMKKMDKNEHNIRAFWDPD